VAIFSARVSDPGERFLTEVALTLHRLGLPSDRLEAVLQGAARQLAVPLVVFAEPTALLLAFGPEDAQRVVVLRVEPSEVDLGHLAAVDQLLRRVERGEYGLDAAVAHMRAVLSVQAWPAPLMVFAHGLASGSAAILFGGTPGDAAASGAIGVVVGLLEQGALRSPSFTRVLVPVASFVATAGARYAVAVFPGVHPGISALSGVIVFLPGLTLTLAMTELATGHLASGVARTASAVVTLLMLIVGVALAEQVVTLPTATALHWAKMPFGLTIPAVVIGAAAFGVLLKARPRDLLPVVLSGVLAYYVATVASDRLGEEIGAGVGAFVIAALSLFYGRLFGRTALVPLVPGVLMLVPGSIGYRSLAAMLGGQVLVGVEQAFRMGMIGAAIAAGLMLAESLRPRTP
jgi:uncharacterized membrane protein YjjP (DUF1212 family)